MMKWLGPVAALFAFAMPAHAQMVRAQDPQSVVAALQGAGYAARLGTDRAGDPMIASGALGRNFQIIFYNCTANKDCATVSFHSGYNVVTPVSVDRINEWNRSQRFGRAYVDKEGRAVLEMDVDLDEGGLSRLLFIDNVQFWSSALGKFEQHIGYRRA